MEEIRENSDSSKHSKSNKKFYNKGENNLGAVKKDRISNEFLLYQTEIENSPFKTHQHRSGTKLKRKNDEKPRIGTMKIQHKKKKRSLSNFLKSHKKKDKKTKLNHTPYETEWSDITSGEENGHKSKTSLNHVSNARRVSKMRNPDSRKSIVRHNPRLEFESEFGRARSQSVPGRVKYMPLRYKKWAKPQKSKTERSEPEVSLKRQSTLKLYSQDKDNEISYPLEHKTIESDLPCKCCKCKKKYAQLMKLNPEVHKLKLLEYCKVNPCCTRQYHKILCNFKDKPPIIRNCCCYHMPLINEKILSDFIADKYCQHDIHMSHKDIQLKSYKICLDPTITNFFYSILEEINYC